MSRSGERGALAGSRGQLRRARGAGPYGGREVSELNGQNTAMWRAMQLAVASGKLLLDLTLPNLTTNINIARAATFRAYAMLFLGSEFCTGTVSSGPEVNNNAMLDSAIFWFTKAIAVAPPMLRQTASLWLRHPS